MKITKSRNLKQIFTLQGGRRFRERYAGLSMEKLLKRKELWLKLRKGRDAV